MSEFTPALLGSRYRKGAEPQVLSPERKAVRDRILTEDDPGVWEEVDCLCGTRGGRVISEVDRHGLGYRKVLCPTCGLLRATPRWTAARYGAFYEEDYRDLYSPVAADARGPEAMVRMAEGPGARQVSAFVRTAWKQHGDPGTGAPTIVEIGSGGGWNLARLPQEWRRIGYDTDARFLRFGHEAFGIEMRHGFLDDALPALGEADCVVLSHVVEHLSDPVGALVALSGAIRPDALILIEVPGIFRLHKTGMDPMRYWQNAHTYTFCARTIASTCRRAGLEPVGVDEWIHLTLRPSSRFEGEVGDDPRLARSMERYLRYCEAAWTTSRSVASLPAVGGPAARVAERGGDAAMRAMMAAGLIRGTRVD